MRACIRAGVIVVAAAVAFAYTALSLGAQAKPAPASELHTTKVAFPLTATASQPER